MGEPGGQVPASVVEFTAQPRAGNHAPVPVALQRAFGDVQCPAHLFAVQSPVVLRWRQMAFQALGKGGEVFHPFEEPLPTPLPDTYDLFHGLLSVWFNIPATRLCVGCTLCGWCRRTFNGPGSERLGVSSFSRFMNLCSCKLALG